VTDDRNGDRDRAGDGHPPQDDDRARTPEASSEGEPPRLRLDDALKLAGIAATGGQAKTLIQSGGVLVNGVVEVRRKRRLSPGDVIEVAGERFEIDLADD
jgi:ribosome-associated protein